MKYTVKDFRQDFPDEDACLEWLVNFLYPEGITCKKCKVVTKHYKVTDRKVYACGACGSQVSPTAGTIYHKSRTPLTDWFYAAYLMSATRSGVSAKQIERQVGVTYKTAWRMMHQIRKMMDTNDGEAFSGEVEIDETFVHANTFKRSSARKKYGFDARRTGQVVLGIVQRGGAVKVWHINGANASTIIPIVREYVKPGTIVHTDGFTAYRYKLPKMGYEHRWTDHGKGQYYTAESYTQNIENVWSHFKRGIKGTYRHIGDGYIQAYADEFAFRYSHRNDYQPMFWAIMGKISNASVVKMDEDI